MESTQNIHAIEEIIKMSESKCISAPPTISSSSSSPAAALPINFLHTDSAIQVHTNRHTDTLTLSTVCLNKGASVYGIFTRCNHYQIRYQKKNWRTVEHSKMQVMAKKLTKVKPCNFITHVVNVGRLLDISHKFF